MGNRLIRAGSQLRCTLNLTIPLYIFYVCFIIAWQHWVTLIEILWSPKILFLWLFPVKYCWLSIHSTGNWVEILRILTRFLYQERSGHDKVSLNAYFQRSGSLLQTIHGWNNVSKLFKNLPNHFLLFSHLLFQKKKNTVKYLCDFQQVAFTLFLPLRILNFLLGLHFQWSFKIYVGAKYN